MPYRSRWVFVIACFWAILSGSVHCEESAKKSSETGDRACALPRETGASFSLGLAGEKLPFTAHAGAICLEDAASGAPRAELAFVSYERAGAESSSRPVVFAFNGGPGASSAWLALGALSPWRLHLGAYAPSSPPRIVDNAETWLAFADLVFIDPPGVGYSKIARGGDDLRKHFFSARGDVEALAVAVRKWLSGHHRLDSPKYLAGESYGGFRVVKLARVLAERESVGVSGLMLVSPALDLAWLEGARNLLFPAAQLPSFAAVARNAKNRRELADVETYAIGEYAADLLKGVQNAEAVSRMSANVARITGLDPEIVARLAGRVDSKTFVRERRRASREVLSFYDGDIAAHDPYPYSRESEWADPVLDSLRAPLGEAMTKIVTEKLGWPIGDAKYEVLDDDIARHWDYGRGGRGDAEALSDLRQALALDPHFKVLVTHGLTDFVTPYFATKILLDQLPSYGDATRLRFMTLPGGHMSYFRDESRKSLRDAARELVEAK